MISKKRIVCLVIASVVFCLFLGATAVQAAKPVIVRDKFCKGRYNVWLPADKSNTYWARWSLGWPWWEYYPNCYGIHDLFVGVVRPGKSQKASEASASGGSWTYEEYYGWVYEWTYGSNHWLEWDIPDNHNRIHVFIYDRNNVYSNIIFSLSSGGVDISDELDTTFYDPNGSGACEEVVLATSSTSSNRKLRLTVAEMRQCAIIGIVSFDDDGIADPSENINGEVVGNDFVDLLHVLTPHYDDNAISGQAGKVLYANSCEFAVYWKECSVTPDLGRWTAYGDYYSVDDAPFTPTLGALLNIDGNDIGEMLDINDIPLGRVFEGDVITTSVKGFGDFYGDGIRGEEDVLEVSVNQQFLKTGLAIKVGMKWTGDAIIWGGPYEPMVCIDPGVTGYLKILPDETEIKIGSNYDNKKGNTIMFYPDNAECILAVQSLGPMDKLMEKPEPALNKMYFFLDMNLLDGGSTPSNGDIWMFGCNFQVTKRGLADLNNDDKVDFEDFTSMAAHWLEGI